MHTEHLFLRPFTRDDAQEFWPLASLPEILRYTGEQAMTCVSEVRAMLIARPLRDYAVRGYGRMACIEKSSGRLVGFSGIKYLEDMQEVDVGYRFLPDCWGKGYATESARVLMEHGAREHGITRFIGLVDPQNLASQRVLEKLGLTFERSLAQDGDATSVNVYATPGTTPAQR